MNREREMGGGAEAEMLERIFVWAECDATDPGRKRETGADGCMTESRGDAAGQSAESNLSIFSCHSQ